MIDAERAAYERDFASVVEAARRKGVFAPDATPPVRRRCVIDGLSLNCLDWQGAAGLPRMLLLHGALLQAHVWDFFSLDMRQQFHIHALDLPGHGDSDWEPNGDYSRATTAARVMGLIQQLELTPLVLVGHSFGGAVAALAAQKLGHRVRALVMVDSTLVPSGKPSVRTRAAGIPQTPNSLRWNARQLADGRPTWKYDPAVREAVLGPADFEDVWSALRSLQAPVLFVRAGENSHLTDQAAERLQRLPNVRLQVVPHAAHNVMTDQPLAFRRAVGDFLAHL